MAKTYRVSGYIVDANGDDLNVLDKDDIFRNEVGCIGDVKIEVSPTWEWDDNCPENFIGCTQEQYEERFRYDV